MIFVRVKVVMQLPRNHTLKFAQTATMNVNKIILREDEHLELKEEIVVVVCGSIYYRCRH